MKLSLFFTLIIIGFVFYVDACKKKIQPNIQLDVQSQTSLTTHHLIEGDIAPQRRNQHSRVSNAFLRDQSKLWPEGIVYYTIDKINEDPFCKEDDIRTIEAALKHITDSVPCLEFRYVDIESPKSKVIFTSQQDDDNKGMDGCWSYIGFQKDISKRSGQVLSGQVLNLGDYDDCFKIETVIHEVLHSLGASHEQSRPDRDNYIKIFWENVIDGKENKDYKRKLGSQFSSYSTEYDFKSIMQYPLNLHSNDGSPIMEAKDSTRNIDFTPTRMSITDIFELGRVYTNKTEKSCFKKENVLEYLQPKRCSIFTHGTGCLAQRDSTGVYNGEWLRWKRHGKGTYTWEDGKVFIGEWKGNKKDGFGVYEYSNGDFYMGEWTNGRIYGKGTFIWKNGDVYTGGLTKSEKNGYGVFNYASGAVYKGYWANDTKNGKGTYTLTNGHVYTGSFKKGDRSGFGTYTWADGNVYKGEWANHMMHGKGTQTWTSGSVYTGDWKNHDISGFGTYTWADGSVYKGEWANHMMHGKGIFTRTDGSVLTGDWINGKNSAR